jgi:hypothetical protein
MKKNSGKSGKKGLKDLKNCQKVVAYEEAAIADCLELMATGAWTPSSLLTIQAKYSSYMQNDKHGVQWVRQCAHVAAQTLRQIQQYTTEDKELLVSDLTAKLYAIYTEAMARKRNKRTQGQAVKVIHDPDYSSAIQAVNSLAKLHNLYSDNSSVVNIQPTYSIINRLTPDEMQEIRATGMIPRSILVDWKASERQEIPGVKGYSPTSHPTLGEYVEDPEALRRKKLNEEGT